MIIFSKLQACGNDFVIIDCIKDYPKYNFSVFSKFLCDRHFGVGADGVIFFLNSKIADVKMRIFNSDGTEAEMCGNGIRCLGKLLYEKGYVKNIKFNIETLSGVKQLKLELENKKVTKIQVNMGKAIFNLSSIPVYLPNSISKDEIKKIEIVYNNRIFNFFPVSVGNPHAVCFVEDFSNFDFEKVGSYVENYKYFPRKTNVEFVKIENNKKLKVKVWERGVGKTLGCGTGAICSASVAMKLLYTESEVIVELDGGTVGVKEQKGEYILSGDAEFVFEGTLKDL